MSEGRRHVLIWELIETFGDEPNQFKSKTTPFPLPLPGNGFAVERVYSAEDRSIENSETLVLNPSAVSM